jgi:methylglutaconyl-CoA hydratase
VDNFETLLVETGGDGVTRVTLNRPEAKNAMSQQLVEELAAAVSQLGADASVRAIVLSGAGDVFCAGGDLKGMKQQVFRSRDERIADATSLARLLAEMNELPKPLIGRINGPAYGGGVGLISVCDVAIGVDTARFALTEVTLGLLPATISPYVVARLGVPNSRRAILTGRKFDAQEAVRIGLLNEIVEDEYLDAAIRDELASTLQCAPQAVAASKKLIRYVSSHDTPENIQYTAEALADAWESAEVAEGIAGFLEKRPPNWRVEPE